MSAPAAGHVDARAELFGLAAELFSFPTEQLAAIAREGGVAQAVEHLAGHLPYEVHLATDGLELPDLDARALEAEYIRLFDIPDGPACPLYTGVYARARRDAMEELLRIYRHFGLTVAASQHDLPDSVPTVLEFLQFLVHREGQVEGDGAAERSARTDVLQRHLWPWADQTARRLEERNAHPFYLSAVVFIRDIAAAEVAYLRAN